MKIAILGAGAMGSWFGGQLALAGNVVQLLTTNDDHIQAVTANGLAMHSAAGEQVIDINISKPENLEANTELIILFTKCFQSQAALEAISSQLGSDTIILSLQNGLGNAETIAAFVGESNTWLGVTMVPVDRIMPGVIACKGEGGTWFGPLSGNQDQKANTILTLFTSAGLNAEYDSHILQRVWGKVAFNAGMNATCALSRGTPGTVGAMPDTKEMVKAVAREVALVAKAEGETINLDTVYNNIDYVCEHHGEHKPSMLQDIMAGRRTEVEALNGAIVERANKYGIEVPINTFLATLVRLAERAQNSN